MSKKDVNKSFGRLIDSAFVNIDGILVEREGTGFRFRGQYFVTRAAVKEQIWKDGEALKKSLNRKK